MKQNRAPRPDRASTSRPMLAPGKRAKPGAWFKAIGGIILLLSFGSQQYFLNKWTDQDSNLKNALLGYSGAYIASLQYYSLYLLQAQVNQVVDPELIQKAAHENALGRTFMILQSDETGSEKIRKSNDALSAAQRVHDIDTYNQFIGDVNVQGGDRLEADRRRIDQIHDNKSRANAIYLVLYLIGSILLIVGGWREGVTREEQARVP